MNAQVASTLESTSLRRFALRAFVSASVLAGTIVSLAGLAWAGPEMGC